MMDNNNYASLFPEGTTIDDETYFKMQQRQQLADLQNRGGMDYSFGQLQQQQQQQQHFTNSFVGSNMLSSNHLDIPQLQMFSGANGQSSMQNMQSQLNNHRQMNSQNNFAGMNQNLASVLPQGHSFLDQGVGNYSSNMMLQQLLLQQAQQDNNSLFQSSFSSGNGLGGDALNMASFSNQHGDYSGFPSQSIERQLEMPSFEQQHCQPLLGLMTLQSLDAADFPVEKRRKTTKNKRDKNRPKQPLSAYNIFFKDERAKMLLKVKQVDAAEEGNSSTGGEDPKSGNKRQREPSSSGKIGFENMAKTIARKWKEITKDDLETYGVRAADDQIRYKGELAVYLEKKRGMENDSQLKK